MFHNVSVATCGIYVLYYNLYISIYVLYITSLISPEVSIRLGSGNAPPDYSQWAPTIKENDKVHKALENTIKIIYKKCIKKILSTK